MKAYEEFIGALKNLDPKSENFEKSLDEHFIEFQEKLGISEEFQIRSANFVIHPIEISENGALNQVVGKPLSAKITLDQIWRDYGSYDGVAQISGNNYYIDTKRIAGKYIDKSGRLFEAPFFEQAEGNDYNINSINDNVPMFQNILVTRECKNGKKPQFKEDFLNQVQAYFKKFETSLKSDFYSPGQQFSKAEMFTILSSVKGVEPFGFSAMQLTNSSDPTCVPQKSNPQSFFKKLPANNNRNILGSYRDGVIAIGNGELKTQIVQHELFHSLINGHEDTKSIMASLLNISNMVPMTVMGVSKLYLPKEQVEENPLGVLDFIRASIARYLSIKNKGDEKFKEISRCYEPLELLNNNLQEPESILFCEDGSKPTFIANYKKFDEEILNKFNKNILLIESSAILAMAVAEIAGKFAGIDEETLGTVSSSVENLTRFTAIGHVYGIESAASSIAVPVLVGGVKAVDAIITKRSGSGLQDRMQSLSKCLIGDDATNSISTKVSACYNSTPKYARDIASQIIFISMIYNILEIQNNMKEDEAKKSSAFGVTLLSSLLTSVASGILRVVISNVLIDKLFPPRYSSQPSNDQDIELAPQAPSPNPVIGSQQREAGIRLEPLREGRRRYDV